MKLLNSGWFVGFHFNFAHTHAIFTPDECVEIFTFDYFVSTDIQCNQLLQFCFLLYEFCYTAIALRLLIQTGTWKKWQISLSPEIAIFRMHKRTNTCTNDTNCSNATSFDSLFSLTVFSVRLNKHSSVHFSSAALILHRNFQLFVINVIYPLFCSELSNFSSNGSKASIWFFCYTIAKQVPLQKNSTNLTYSLSLIAKS